MSSTINFLTLSQEIEINFKTETVSDTLNLVESIETNLYPYSLDQFLILQQIIAANCDKDLEISHTLTMTQSMLPRVLIESVSDFLFAWQEPIAESHAPLEISSLTLAQQVDQTNAKFAESELALTQEIVVVWDKTLEVEQTLTMYSSVTGHLPSRFWSSIPITVVEP